MVHDRERYVQRWRPVIFIFLCTAASFVASPAIVQAFSSGKGSAGDPYRISTCGELQSMNDNTSAHYLLTGDIDCTATGGWNGGAGFAPIGTGVSPFTGTLDGYGHIIKGLTINRPSADRVGLFGAISSASGRVQRLGLEGGNIIGQDRTGGIAGELIDGTITQVYVTGITISGRGQLGGLVGIKTGGALVSSYTRAAVLGTDTMVGGALGSNKGLVSNVYATGTVQAADYAGGLLGQHNGGAESIVENSFSLGSVVTGGSPVARGGLIGSSAAAISNSYWFNHSGTPNTCVGLLISGSVDCTPVAAASHPPYFFNAANAPMNSWDFFNIWAFSATVNDRLPYLLWQTSPPELPALKTYTVASSSASQSALPASVYTAADTPEPPSVVGDTAKTPLSAGTNEATGLPKEKVPLAQAKTHASASRYAVAVAAVLLAGGLLGWAALRMRKA